MSDGLTNTINVTDYPNVIKNTSELLHVLTMATDDGVLLSFKIAPDCV